MANASADLKLMTDNYDHKSTLYDSQSLYITELNFEVSSLNSSIVEYKNRLEKSEKSILDRHSEYSTELNKLKAELGVFKVSSVSESTNVEKIFRNRIDERPSVICKVVQI